MFTNIVFVVVAVVVVDVAFNTNCLYVVVVAVFNVVVFVIMLQCVVL